MSGGIVGRREMPIGWGYIRGYAKPKYGTSVSNKTTTTVGTVPVEEVAPITNANVKIDYAKSFNKNIAKTYTTTTKLNLRAGAGTNKQIVTVIPKGDQVTCYGYHTNGWYYVKYKNLTGFCDKSYLK